MATDLNVDVKELVGNENLVKNIQPKKYATEEIGELTIKDILNELKKPGLDPRSDMQQFEFAPIYKIEDVMVGMVVPGVITNITRFGVFVDIGVKQDGLVHVSEIAHRYISDPNEAVKLNDKVVVKVMEVDVPRKRIALSIKQASEAPNKQEGKNRAFDSGSKFKETSDKRQDTRNKFQGNQTKGASTSETSMNDALNALRKKFGK